MTVKTSSTEYGSSEWPVRIIQKIHELGDVRPRSRIYKVPNLIRKVDVDEYSPHIVSIGPFHSSTTTRSVLPQRSVNKDQLTAEEDKWQYMLSLQQTLVKKHDHLLAMEAHKLWYMRYLFNRMQEKSPDEKIAILLECGEAILQEEKKVRGSYAENIRFESLELAEIMLVDGCFILELFLRSWLQDSTSEDPIFHNDWMIPALRCDLSLLENQIPFFILQKLFEIVKPHFPEDKRARLSLITYLALSFFHPELHLNQATEIPQKCSQLGRNRYFHLLHLLHQFYLPGEPCDTATSNPVPDHQVAGRECANDHTMDITEEESNSSEKEEEGESQGFEKCATKLFEAGIDFNKGDEEDLLFDIRFCKVNGVITIPPLRTDKTTKSLLWNLTAFEQCGGSKQHHITSYTILIKSLIRSSADIGLLMKKGIIPKHLGRVEDFSTLFNDISREDFPKDCYFGKLCKAVSEYQKSWWNCQRIMAVLEVKCDSYMDVLKRKYFSSPWSIISVLAACALFVVAIIQTYYAACS